MTSLTNTSFPDTCLASIWRHLAMKEVCAMAGTWHTTEDIKQFEEREVKMFDQAMKKVGKHLTDIEEIFGDAKCSIERTIRSKYKRSEDIDVLHCYFTTVIARFIEKETLNDVLSHVILALSRLLEEAIMKQCKEYLALRNIEEAYYAVSSALVWKAAALAQTKDPSFDAVTREADKSVIASKEFTLTIRKVEKCIPDCAMASDIHMNELQRICQNAMPESKDPFHDFLRQILDSAMKTVIEEAFLRRLALLIVRYVTLFHEDQ